MALMLLRIPPSRRRVHERAWKAAPDVTDHDAHAWVEAWFAGYGWLTFDPTPGRGTLSATYTNASDSADAIRALGTGKFLGAGFVPRNAGRGVAPVAKATGGGIPWRLIIPFAALARPCSSSRSPRASPVIAERTSDPRRRASRQPVLSWRRSSDPGSGQRVSLSRRASSSCGGWGG
jgi:hypothetical protein